MSLMKQIRAFPVPKNQIGIWWFGQNGFIFKSPEGTLASVDLYLTDSCATLTTALNLRRQIPILLAPEEVDVDIFTCTHNHQDHTDPETIRGLRNKDAIVFAGPMPSCGIFREEKVEEGRIQPTWPDGKLEYKDLKITGTFALPTDSTDLNHMGFVFQFGSGPRIYVTGDTAPHELLSSAARHQPDLMISCINGGFNNLSAWQAGHLASQIKPKLAIGCHYDMFPDNCANPRMFRAALAYQAPEVRFEELQHAKPFLFGL